MRTVLRSERLWSVALVFYETPQHVLPCVVFQEKSLVLSLLDLWVSTVCVISTDFLCTGVIRTPPVLPSYRQYSSDLRYIIQTNEPRATKPLIRVALWVSIPALKFKTPSHCVLRRRLVWMSLRYHTGSLRLRKKWMMRQRKMCNGSKVCLYEQVDKVLVILASYPNVTTKVLWQNNLQITNTHWSIISFPESPLYGRWQNAPHICDHDGYFFQGQANSDQRGWFRWLQDSPALVR